jgi:hypothetical protein
MDTAGLGHLKWPEMGDTCTTPMEALRSASKCNTVPEKQFDLLNTKVENNTIMKLLTNKVNPTT